MLEINKIYNENCLIGMQKINDKSINMILCDLPYKMTECKWDIIIPFEDLWKQYKRIIKDNGAIALFGKEPFSTLLRMSNLKWFKYDWIWEKNRPSGFAQSKNKPLSNHEIISIFSNGVTVHANQSKRRMKYYPQGLIKINKKMKNNSKSFNKDSVFGYRENAVDEYIQEYTNYPKTVLKFNNEVGLHPTQKPKELCKYLIKTYTLENELVLDNCMGSGTTAIACIESNRDFIGFENDPKYYSISLERIKNNQIIGQKNK